MRHYILTTAIFCCIIQITYSQRYDSTTQFQSSPLETVRISSWTIFEDNIEDTLRLADTSERSSLLILDETLRHCYITAKLIEYKDGLKLREAIVLYKEAIYNNPQIQPFEDSSFVFSLYRKPLQGNQFIWGFRTPSTMRTEKVEMAKSAEYWPYLGLQEHKLPIGKPFIYLVITTPDNLSGFFVENKNNAAVYDWNKTSNIKHAFIIELTIEKSPDHKQNNHTNKS
jgi:hypothetical protein